MSAEKALSKNNKSGVRGVYWDSRSSKWRVKISICGEKKSVGYFSSFEDACEARRKAEELQKYRGDMWGYLCAQIGSAEVAPFLYRCILDFPWESGEEFSLFCARRVSSVESDAEGSEVWCDVGSVDAFVERLLGKVEEHSLGSVLNANDLILRLFVSGCSFRKIGKIVGQSPTTVRKALSNFCNMLTNYELNKKGLGGILQKFV